MACYKHCLKGERKKFMKLEGKKALVTGASRGIGRAIALALAAEGADVVVNYAGSEAAAKAVAAEIEAMGRKALVLQADISSNEAATAMLDAAVKEFGRIDILVNNAGITRDGLLMRMKEEDWDAVLNTNLKSAYYCTKAVTKLMMKKRYGRIVNMTSVVGLTGNISQANYAAAKAGLIKGDIITALNGEEIKSMDDLKNELSYYTAGTTVELTIMQGSPTGYQAKTVEVTLGAATSTQ